MKLNSHLNSIKYFILFCQYLLLLFISKRKIYIRVITEFLKFNFFYCRYKVNIFFFVNKMANNAVLSILKANNC